MRPAIVDVRDLVHRYAWSPRSVEELVAAAGLVVTDETTRSFAPPAVVVAIVGEPVVPYGKTLQWLSGARRLIILRDRRGGDDVDIQAPDGAEILDWTDAASARAAVEHAIEVARDIEPVAVERPDPQIIELASGPWFDVDAPDYWHDRAIVAQLAIRDGRAMLATDASGAEIDLASPPHRVRIERIAPPASSFPAGRDPIHSVGWLGQRMGFHFTYRDAYLAMAEHDWPCGPAKKLYGYDDNDTLQVTMAPDASIVAARFDHDVTITEAVPLAWHRAGPVDVAMFARDPRRAAFFARDPDGGYPHDPELPDDDEDARDIPPVLVLGPEPKRRYALDLKHLVVKVTGAMEAPRFERIQPGGFAIYDADHQLVAQRPGRLLGGWWRWATVEDDGAFWREDLATGARTRLGPADLSICTDPDVELVARDAMREGRHDDAARIRAGNPSTELDVMVLALPGTRNVLLVAGTCMRVL